MSYDSLVLNIQQYMDALAVQPGILLRQLLHFITQLCRAGIRIAHITYAEAGEQQYAYPEHTPMPGYLCTHRDIPLCNAKAMA